MLPTMSDATQPFAPPTAPTRQALEAVNRSYPGKVTGRLRAALTAMVWQGARRAEAAKIGGMTDHSLRAALRKPHVKSWYLAELGVLRESERPKTFHRLCDLRDQDENKNAAVAAAKALEQISDEQLLARSSNAPSPGVTIVIRHARADGLSTHLVRLAGVDHLRRCDVDRHVS
jgi:hypothetical protein